MDKTYSIPHGIWMTISELGIEVHQNSGKVAFVSIVGDTMTLSSEGQWSIRKHNG